MKIDIQERKEPASLADWQAAFCELVAVTMNTRAERLARVFDAWAGAHSMKHREDGHNGDAWDTTIFDTSFSMDNGGRYWLEAERQAEHGLVKITLRATGEDVLGPVTVSTAGGHAAKWPEFGEDYDRQGNGALIGV